MGSSVRIMELTKCWNVEARRFCAPHKKVHHVKHVFRGSVNRGFQNYGSRFLTKQRSS